MTMYQSDRLMRHIRHATIHRCRCGSFYERIEATTMLSCIDCGSVRWLV